MKKITLLLCMLIVYMGSHAQIIEKFELNPSDNGMPMTMVPFKNKLYFYACTPAAGQEMIYTSGGATPTFTVLEDIFSTIDCPVHILSWMNHCATVVNDHLVFTARPGTSTDGNLYVYDGINPVKMADASTPFIGLNPMNMVAMNNLLYYSATGTNDRDLYVYNPITDVERLLVANAFGFSGIDGNNMVAFKGKLYVQGYNAATGSELYSYTPGQSSVVLVHDINAGTDGSFPQCLLVHNGKLYFVAGTTTHGNELWSYDGTNPPTRLTDVAPGAGNGVDPLLYEDLVVYNNAVYFSGTDGTNGNELYKYDIATGNTSLVFEFRTSADGGDPASFKVYKNKLYFNATDSAEGPELWIYDGINPPQMTILYPGNTGSQPFEFTEFQGDLYFRALDTAIGRELFRIHDTTTPPDTSTYIPAIATSPMQAIVYPNPTHDAATLELTMYEPQTFGITLSDVYGRTVHTIPPKQYNAGTQRITLPMQSLAAGMYYYRISNGNAQLASGKVMKE